MYKASALALNDRFLLAHAMRMILFTASHCRNEQPALALSRFATQYQRRATWSIRFTCCYFTALCLGLPQIGDLKRLARPVALNAIADSEGIVHFVALEDIQTSIKQYFPP